MNGSFSCLFAIKRLRRLRLLLRKQKYNVNKVADQVAPDG